MKTIFLYATVFLICINEISLSQGYPDDFSFVEVPNLLAEINPTYPIIERDVPTIGNSFYDLHFGTILTRVTQTNGIRGRHEYSCFDPFNAEKSMILLDPEALWNVYYTSSYPYNQAGNFVMTVELEEPRWDPNDQNLIWGLDEFKIMITNVITGQTSIIKDFTLDPILGPVIAQDSVFRITTRDEGESSVDKRYWAFFLQGDERVDYNQRYIFTWDATLDSILGLYKIAANEVDVDNLGISPLGNYVVIGGDSWNGGNLNGLVIANKELTRFRSFGAIGHSDVGIDINGNEVIVGQNAGTDYIDLMPFDFNASPIQLVRLFYSNDSPSGLQSGVHVSCNVPGYCVISTYIEAGLLEQNWLDRTIILIKLDPQDLRAFYLAKVYNTTGSYWEEAHATITNDGSKVLWASNWNQNVGQEQVFLMQLDMPPNWRKLTPVEETRGSKFDGFELMQNYPNPFNPVTKIKYQIPELSFAKLKVFNVVGKEIATLVNEEKPVGSYEVEFDATKLSSGIYFYKLQAGSFFTTKKMVLLR